MKWYSAAVVSPVNFAVREKSDGHFTFIGTDARMYRTNLGTDLIPIGKKCQPPEKFKDWAIVSHSNEYAKQLAELKAVKIKFEEAALASPIGWAYRDRTDGKGGHVFVKPVKGHAPLIFSSTRNSKNPREIGNPGDLDDFRDWKSLVEPFGDLLEQSKRYPRNLKELTFTDIQVKVIETTTFVRPTGLAKLAAYYIDLRKDLMETVDRINKVEQLTDPALVQELEGLVRLATEMKDIL